MRLPMNALNDAMLQKIRENTEGSWMFDAEPDSTRRANYAGWGEKKVRKVLWVLPAVDVRLVAEKEYGDVVVVHFGAICVVVADKIVVEG